MSPDTTRLAPALRLPLLSLCLSLALIAAPAWAQTITGRIDGRVTDTSGAVLPGATVTIVNAGTGFTVALPTDASGRLHRHQPAGRHLHRDGRAPGLPARRSAPACSSAPTAASPPTSRSESAS